MTVTVKQFEDVLEEGVPYEYTPWKATETVADTLEGSDFWGYEGREHEPFEVPGFGTLVYVDGETGGEGSAENIWQVWSVTDADGIQYFMKTGYYMSYDGSNWDGDLHEVEPFEKTVTDWRTKR